MPRRVPSGGVRAIRLSLLDYTWRQFVSTSGEPPRRFRLHPDDLAEVTAEARVRYVQFGFVRLEDVPRDAIAAYRGVPVLGDESVTRGRVGVE